MAPAWYIVFMLIFIFALFIIPYTIFFYEEDDSLALTGRNDCKKALCSATKYMVGVVVIVALVSGILFVVLGQSDVPVRDFEFDMPVLLSTGDLGNRIDILQGNGVTEDLTVDRSVVSEAIIDSEDSVVLQLSFPVFVMALMSFVGWILFVFFGGLGLVGIPIDSIRSFTTRPQRLDRGQVAVLEGGIKRRCDDLVSVGEQLKGVRQDTREAIEGGQLRFLERRRRNNNEAKEFNQFKQAVSLLEEDYPTLEFCKDYFQKFNPVKPFAWLLFGILASIIALVWIIHMVIFMIIQPSITPFLNDYFLWFDKWFPLFGVLSVAVFSFYLLAACVKGCFKFGLRLVWFTLHPMKPNGTYMNSFLFNCGIIFMCGTPVIQFTVQAFSAYLRNTDVTNFFNVQVRYVRFFRYFFENNVFIIALLILTVFSGIYLSCRPVDSPVSAQNIQETLRKSAEYQSAHSTNGGGGAAVSDENGNPVGSQ
ncbi:conserved unknown protein [Ectocarpus siliculosus]|uniref:Uncharacterized protein n=1 Tax=Ectocarpus siliculosus TaxID=2880 RepID=D7FRZ6_ECTSI|nr:conserved unknown protein [Ectocarpus siliculosus]|eukprot:CBJ30937.1 conserved unknown protein [Ectocarpus siliculosus]